jgi:hypothetical protein
MKAQGLSHGCISIPGFAPKTVLCRHAALFDHYYNLRLYLLPIAAQQCSSYGMVLGTESIIALVVFLIACLPMFFHVYRLYTRRSHSLSYQDCRCAWPHALSLDVVPGTVIQILTCDVSSTFTRPQRNCVTIHNLPTFSDLAASYRCQFGRRCAQGL